MRPIISGRLYVGTQSDCQVAPEGWAIVHACKYPCHANQCGSAPKGTPHYLHYEDGTDLYLNLIDPPAAELFQLESFVLALDFMQRQWEAGKRLLVHCNQGQSRSASLALLFCAKILGNISSADYDSAWDEFEALSGETYAPGGGIEKYLRKHWREIESNPIAYIAGAAQPKPQPQSEPLTQSQAESLALVQNDPYTHFWLFARIRDKDEQLTPMDGRNEPNSFQEKFIAVYLWCVANRIPIRIVAGPKPRQSGGSTISAEICYHHSMRTKSSAMVIGDEGDRTDLLWDMWNNLAMMDRAKGIWGVRHTEKDWNTEKSVFYYTNPEGVEMTFQWLRDTANDPKAGASGTRRILWFSEAGRYSKSGVVTDMQVISNASSSVPESPDTLIIMESTAEGATGKFYQTVKGAVTLEQRKNGEYGNGFIKVSCWWWEVPEYKLSRTVNNAPLFRPALDEREKRGVERYSWTAEQVAWRRSKIDGQFEGCEALFDQEYPESEDVAFLSSGAPRFNVAGLTHLKDLAMSNHCLATTGQLVENGKVMKFLEVQDDAWLWVREKPTYNLSYIISVDCMTGRQSAGSKKRDAHAVCVWREAYVDKQSSELKPARLVATVHVKGGCHWDEDILADRIRMLSNWYGGCIVAIEVNMALGVLACLRKLHVHLWKRTEDDDNAPGQTLSIEGWSTTPKTRGNLVTAMARAVREQRVMIEYEPMVHELFMFEIKDDGSCSAKEGEHDDFVMSGSIGLLLIEQATTYGQPAQVHATFHVDPVNWSGKGTDAFS